MQLIKEVPDIPINIPQVVRDTCDYFCKVVTKGRNKWKQYVTTRFNLDSSKRYNWKYLILTYVMAMEECIRIDVVMQGRHDRVTVRHETFYLYSLDEAIKLAQDVKKQ